MNCFVRSASIRSETELWRRVNFGRGSSGTETAPVVAAHIYHAWASDCEWFLARDWTRTMLVHVFANSAQTLSRKHCTRGVRVGNKQRKILHRRRPFPTSQHLLAGSPETADHKLLLMSFSYYEINARGFKKSNYQQRLIAPAFGDRQ